MLITDLVAGGYSPAVMFAVYGCMALPALLGVLARRDLRGVQGAGALLGPVRYVRALLLALSCGLAFFAVTNLAVFLSAGDGAYPRSLAGLAECYWAALPFYRNGVAADLIYGALVFGGYGVVRGRVLAGRAVSQTINTADNIG
jgi:hypothetical protein